jgi:hypothetical protein
MTTKITAWSHSRWACYEECPRKAKYKFIDKLSEPQGEALARGSEIHAKIEKYLRDGGRMPKEITSLKDVYKELRERRPFVELQLAFDKDWNPADWFGPKTWCRVMIDSLVPPVVDGDRVVLIDDHKTGKVKEAGEYDTQLELYGLSGLLHYPSAEKSRARLLFVDHGRTIEAAEEFTRKDIQKLEKKWERRVKSMLADTRFAPNPGNACRWCHFKKNNGGPCDY